MYYAKDAAKEVVISTLLSASNDDLKLRKSEKILVPKSKYMRSIHSVDTRIQKMPHIVNVLRNVVKKKLHVLFSNTV